MEKKISSLALEDFIIELEDAENLIEIFEEFADDECPHLCQLDSSEQLASVLFSRRFPTYITALRSAARQINKVITDLSGMVFEAS